MKKLYRTFIGCLVLTGMVNSANAQTSMPCGTSEISTGLRAAHPDLVQQAKAYETELSQKIAQKSERSSTVYIIPIVFHVIHVNGAENISDASIIAQVQRLNIDYRKLNSDTSSIVPAFQGLAADVQVEFRLAQKDPDGNCTNGIDRIYSHKTFNAGEQSKLNQWPRDKYLNVWVVHDIPSGSSSGTVLAYAHFPSDVATYLYPFDGVIMIYGQCNGSSRTLTHEIGHYLSLQHTWGSTNSPEVACGDDNVSDTPITMGHFSTCPAYDSTCTPGVLENIQNYMDYSNCIMMFTYGQRDRMRAALESNVSSRNNLWSAANLAATGVDGTGTACAPIPDFYANKYTICPGGSVNFTRNILNTLPTSVATATWTFTGGTPSTFTGTGAPPAITYAATGDYPVTMVATNSVGSGTITKNAYIHVLPTSAYYYGQAQESFENSTDFYYHWMIDDLDAGTSSWSYSNSGYNSGHSVMMSAYNSYSDDVDNLVSPAFNMYGLSGVTMTFRCAAASRATSTSNMTEVLKVYVSTDCGATWSARKTFSAFSTIPGNTFITNGYHPEFYVPGGQGDWALLSVSVPASMATSNTKFKFEYTSGSLGNNVYIDDVNITGTVGISENTMDESSVSIYPNPTNQNTTVSYHLNKKGSVQVHLMDVLGKTLMMTNNGTQSEGDYQFNISRAELGLKEGIYFVRITVDNASVTRKLVITQ